MGGCRCSPFASRPQVSARSRTIARGVGSRRRIASMNDPPTRETKVPNRSIVQSSCRKRRPARCDRDLVRHAAGEARPKSFVFVWRRFRARARSVGWSRGKGGNRVRRSWGGGATAPSLPGTVLEVSRAVHSRVCRFFRHTKSPCEVATPACARCGRVGHLLDTRRWDEDEILEWSRWRQESDPIPDYNTGARYRPGSSHQRLTTSS